MHFRSRNIHPSHLCARRAFVCNRFCARVKARIIGMAMNLLPDSYKKTLFFERARRFTRFAGSLLTLVVITGVVLLLPSYFFLYFQEAELARAVAAVERGERLDRCQKKQIPIVAIFEDIINRTPPGIVYTSINYSKSQNLIAINGKAPRPVDIIALDAALEKSEFVQSSVYPLTSLLGDRDIAFTLNITVQY